MRDLTPKATSIECVDHPEWGTWGIRADLGGSYEIYNGRGSRILDKWEAEHFWRVANMDAATRDRQRRARILNRASDRS